MGTLPSPCNYDQKLSNDLAYPTRGKITECYLAWTEAIFLNHEGTFGNQEGMIT